MALQVVGYNGMFPKMLRELLDRHPMTGARTTLKELAEAVGIRQQTVSLYKNGETQPTPETLVKIAEFFGVSVDYLLTGISSQNKPIHEELGLTEEAIGMLKVAKETEGFDGMPSLLDTLNGLLSDRDFYDFLDDVTFKAQQVKAALNGNIDKSNMGNFDVEGYYIWDLQKYIEEFILKQLVKRGLTIEERTIKINRPESEE
jgi:transcriptional regulator with XRE-family HTH domain